MAPENDILQLSLLAICQDLHSSMHGRADKLDEATRKGYVEYLKLRLEKWTEPDMKSSKQFDLAVQLLICMTLNEQQWA